MTQPLVLGIETSCDETGAGLVRGHELLADSVASSVAEHARFGGVVPEVASRAHLEAMVATVDRALATAGVKLAEVDGIANSRLRALAAERCEAGGIALRVPRPGCAPTTVRWWPRWAPSSWLAARSRRR
jgi:hypothetical protein